MEKDRTYIWRIFACYLYGFGNLLGYLGQFKIAVEKNPGEWYLIIPFWAIIIALAVFGGISAIGYWGLRADYEKLEIEHKGSKEYQNKYYALQSEYSDLKSKYDFFVPIRKVGSKGS